LYSGHAEAASGSDDPDAGLLVQRGFNFLELNPILGGVAFNQGFLAFSITVCGTAVASFARLTPPGGE
jgi:hypothetical protein